MKTKIRNLEDGHAMERASDEIAINLAGAIRRRYQAARVAAPLRTIDLMLEDLELLNLAGRRRVPTYWDLPLARLVASLPIEIRAIPELRSNIATTRLMDRLYDLQDMLLDIKMGPARRRLIDFDTEQFGLADIELATYPEPEANFDVA